MNQSNRIQLLDSFRFLAISFVIMYHFFSSWTQPEFNGNYYPYGNILSQYFKYGFLGVQFFFIISGFVIFFTLEKSQKMTEFITKRFIRLFPAMILCSLITYILVPILDHQNNFPTFHSKTLLDFLPSLTFTTPFIWNWLLNTDNIEYVCGVYWSLWVEMVFYIFAGGIYFFRKDKFLSNWTYFVILTILFRIVQSPELSINIVFVKELYTVVNFFRYTTYFTLGILFYSLYSKKNIPNILYFVSGVLIILEMIKYKSLMPCIIILSMLILFLLFIYKPNKIAFLDNKLFNKIGVSSYVLYLIHEYIGIILVTKLSFIDFFSQIWILPPLLIFIFMIGLSIFLNVFFEIPINKLIRKKLFDNLR